MKKLKNKFLLAIFAFCGIAISGYSQDGPMEGVVAETQRENIDATKLQQRGNVADGKTRKIVLLEDRDQNYMTTKVYEIKNMKAVDLRPFVEGAVFRADPESRVSRLNYKFGKKQFLGVTMPNYMVPYIDDMVKKLDRPGIKDPAKSVIAGTGIHHFYYKPNYRSTEVMLDVVFERYTGGDEIVFRDPESNLFYWKGSASDGKDIGKWLKAIDRPVPQMEVRVKIYQISEDNLVELGIDWVALKNGPGAELFGIGMDFLDFQSMSDISSWANMLDLSSIASYTSPGLFIAPNIDMTFLRLLNQKGRSRTATSGYLTITNDQNGRNDAFGNSANPAAFANARYRIRFNPVFQAITKDNNEIAIEGTQPGITLYFQNPVIGHNNTKNPTEGAFLNTGWVLNVDNALSEQSATGDRIEDDYNFFSNTTIGANSEKLLATYVKHHKVTQNNGVPFLGDIPGLKYIFGASTDSMKKYRYYVTLEAKPVLPDRNWGQWAGQIVTADKMLEKYSESNETSVLPAKNDQVQIPYLWNPNKQ